MKERYEEISREYPILDSIADNKSVQVKKRKRRSAKSRPNKKKIQVFKRNKTLKRKLPFIEAEREDPKQAEGDQNINYRSLNLEQNKKSNQMKKSRKPFKKLLPTKKIEGTWKPGELDSGREANVESLKIIGEKEEEREELHRIRNAEEYNQAMNIAQEEEIREMKMNHASHFPKLENQENIELKEELAKTQKEKEFLSGKLFECEEKLLTHTQNEIVNLGLKGIETYPAIHLKLHEQQKLIEKLKCELCSLKQEKNLMIKDFQHESSGLKKELEYQKKEVETQRKESQKIRSELEKSKEKSAKFEKMVYFLKSKLARKNKQLKFMSDNLENLDLGNSESRGESIFDRDWELRDLLKQAGQLKNQQMDLNTFLQ